MVEYQVSRRLLQAWLKMSMSRRQFQATILGLAEHYLVLVQHHQEEDMLAGGVAEAW